MFLSLLNSHRVGLVERAYSSDSEVLILLDLFFSDGSIILISYDRKAWAVNTQHEPLRSFKTEKDLKDAGLRSGGIHHAPSEWV